MKKIQVTSHLLHEKIQVICMVLECNHNAQFCDFKPVLDLLDELVRATRSQHKIQQRD